MVWYAEQDNQLRPAEGTKGLRPICVPTSAGFFIGDKMKRIPLTQDKYAIVDDEDYEYLNQWKWMLRRDKNNLYVVRGVWVNNKVEIILMHRLIMNCPKDMEIDHINHNGLDNRRYNLRICTHAQNCQNRKPYKNKLSKHKGVTWRKDSKKWKAQIRFNGKQMSIGSYITESEAIRAYNKKAKELFGEFAYLNGLADTERSRQYST